MIAVRGSRAGLCVAAEVADDDHGEERKDEAIHEGSSNQLTTKLAKGTKTSETPLWILLIFVAFVFFAAFVFQKSICALNFAKRAVITVVGVSHGPFAMKFSL